MDRQTFPASPPHILILLGRLPGIATLILAQIQAPAVAALEPAPPLVYPDTYIRR